MTAIEHYDAKHAGVIPRRFENCPHCGRLSAWDIARDVCVACKVKGVHTLPNQQPLTLVSFVVPRWGHAGAHDRLVEGLLSAYGGYTTYPVSGVWRAPGGREVSDYMTRYEVAMSAAGATHFRLTQAAKVRDDFGEEAIYVIIAGVPSIIRRGS